MPPHHFTLPDLVALLAALQRAPQPLRHGRDLTAGALTHLARTLDPAAAPLRVLRANPPLALALWLLLLADLLSVRDGWLTTGARLADWLHATPPDALAHLVAALDDSARADALRQQLRLADVLTIDRIAALRQRLDRRRAQPPAAPSVARLTTHADHWQITPGPRPPLHACFQLHLCAAAHADRLHLSPFTLAAARPHLDLRAVQHALQTALQRPLTSDEQQQLQQWWQRADAVQLAPHHLLHVADPATLSALKQRRQLRRHIVRQISPLAAIVDPAIELPLRRYLAAQNIPLAPLHPPAAAPASAADQWLALRVLQQLGQWLPLPTPTLAHTLAAAGQPLDAATLATLAARANALIADLQRLLRGDDAFEPAAAAPAADLIATLQAAIAAGQPITIRYQGIADAAPRARTITPLYLEQRGALHYCVAHCHSAAAERVFRLDRCSTI